MPSRNKMLSTVTNKRYIKYVKRAHMWCRTIFDDKGKQTTEFFSTKEEAEKI